MTNMSNQTVVLNNHNLLPTLTQIYCVKEAFYAYAFDNMTPILNKISRTKKSVIDISSRMMNEL